MVAKKTVKTPRAVKTAKPAVAVKTAKPAVAAKTAKPAVAVKTAKPVVAVKTAAAVRPSVEAVLEVGKQNLDTVVKAGTETASKGYEQLVANSKSQVTQAVALTKENVDKTSEAVFRGYDDMASLGKDNLDALVQTNTAVAKGFETLGKEWLAFTQATLEDNIAQAQALFGAKNLKEVVDLQNDFARARMDRTIAETAKLTELSVQVANEAIEPLQKRVDVTVGTIFKAHAA